MMAAGSFLTLSAGAWPGISLAVLEICARRGRRAVMTGGKSKQDQPNGVVIVTNPKKTIHSWLTIAPKAFLIAISIMAPGFAFGQSFQVTSRLVAHAGPGESYPIARELAEATHVTKVTEDANGWVAIRLDDGEVVWVPSESFQTKLALLTTILPLGLPGGAAPAEDGPRRDIPSPGAVLLATGESNNNGQVVNAASFTPTNGDGWRPASSVPRNFDTRPRETSLQRQTPSTGVLGGVPTLQATEVGPDRFLDEVDQELSAMLTKHPALWQIKPLQDKLAALAGKPLTTAQIERIESLAQKLAIAGNIADLWRGTQQQNQGVVASPGMARAGLWQQPGPFVGPFSDPAPISVAPPVGGFTALSTVVPPPSTRLPTERSDRNISVVHNTAQIQATPQPVPLPRIDFPAVAPVSFDVPSSTDNAQLSQPIMNDSRSEAFPPVRDVQPSSTSSLREEIARELNDLRRQRFDAVGRLVKAQVRRPSDPPYMVVNESGGIVCYVKPAPGTLLRTYVGHWVGISGRKTRLADGRGPLITAESLKLLDPPAEGPQS